MSKLLANLIAGRVMRLPMDPPAAHPASGLQNRAFWELSDRY